MLALERYPTGFLSDEETELHRHFLADGHVIIPAADPARLDRLRAAIAGLAAHHHDIGCRRRRATSSMRSTPGSAR